MKKEDMQIGKYYYVKGSMYKGIVKAVDLYKNNFEYTDVMQYEKLDGRIGYTKCINVEREITDKSELIMEMLK